ncbi:MAG TPA: DUF4126 family protein [Solirubrobacteraceae bacterium]
MRLLLDILQGAGVAGAAGLRPFLPALVSGGLAIANVGVNYDGTDFAFLESPVFLILIALAAAVSLGLERRGDGSGLETGTLGAFYGGVALGLGALLCAGSIDDGHDTWWYGLLIGLACAGLAQAAVRDLFRRVRGRLDAESRAALPIYAEAAALLSAFGTILFPPLAVVVLGFLVWLLIGSRRRSEQKYAGLRILR